LKIRSVSYVKLRFYVLIIYALIARFFIVLDALKLLANWRMHVGYVKLLLMNQSQRRTEEMKILFQLFNIFSIFDELFFLIALLLLIFLLISYTILTLIVIWVYKDAKKKKINAAVWVLIVWITPFFVGLIRYLIYRKKINSSN
jgi:hypothetical protein